METLDLVRSWKRPDLRTDGMPGHPAGAITLRTSGALARRADLLAGYGSAYAETVHLPYETMSCPVAPGEGDDWV
ncbi:hypothetical protein ACIGXM_22820 [Kitasatospora sp. NPDC052896]|uniref:hypothetical protein n=1 Tax=Kitasatospora sp. NPDC052896 TaxID=3364061 RepID=UPI0037C721C7